MTETAPHTSSTGHPTSSTAHRLRTAAAGAFALAVLVAIAEAAVAVVSIATQHGADGALVAQVLVRGLIYAAALICSWFLARGRRWAWWALLLGIGVVGLASMVLPMAAALADGASWFTALDGDVSPVFPVLRALHILLVLVGVALLLRGDVRASLRAAAA